MSAVRSHFSRHSLCIAQYALCIVLCIALAAAGVAQAASTNEFAAIDIMETVRQSAVESPFTASFTGELNGSVSMQLFDGDLTADSTKSADKNGRAIFILANGPSVTVSFNPAAFGNRPVILWQYGFRMWASVANSSWVVASRLPKSWTVSVSSKEHPMTEDDWVLVHSMENHTSYTPLVDGCYAADFQVEIPVVDVRHVRFVFTGTTGNDTYLSLGEILMSGLVAPDGGGRRDVCLYKTAPVVANADGSATAKVSILPTGAEIDPYDLFVTYGTGDSVATNLLESATRFTGLYETTIPGLRFGADYTLQFGTVATNGMVELGEAVPFSTSPDVMPAGVLPGGFEAVEYIESTDTGNQCIDCGFAPKGVFGFDLDFIGFNAFQRGAYYDTGNRDTGYGCYLTASANLVLSSSTGSGGGYTTGMFLYNGAKKAGLVRNERMRFLVGGGMYTTIVGTTTNSTTFARSSLNGPNLFLAASCNGAGTTNQYGVMRIYSLKTYDDSVNPRELTHDFVPARRIADDTYGLYDLVVGVWRPNGNATPFLAGPAVQSGDRLELSSVRYTGRQLTATLTRGWTGATDVYAAWGSTYGGIDAANWQHTERLGAFAENEQSANFTTPGLGRDAIYVRFYTADGKWSETLYLPDQTMIPAGLFIFMR